MASWTGLVPCIARLRLRKRWVNKELSLKLLQSVIFKRSWPQHQQPQVPGGHPGGGLVGVKHSWHSCWEIRSWTDSIWTVPSSLSASSFWWLKSCAMDHVNPVPPGMLVAWYQAAVSISSWSPSPQAISILSDESMGTFMTLSQLSAPALGRSIHNFRPQIWLCIVITPGRSWSTCSGFPAIGLDSALEPKNDHTVPVGCQSLRGMRSKSGSTELIELKKSVAASFSNTKLLYHSCWQGVERVPW